MEITELPPTPLVLPAGGELVHIRTQEWAVEWWEGEDPPGLAVPWGRKPKFSVNGSRSCAELAIVHHLRAGGWDGVWVNAFRGELRTQWFPAPAAWRLAEVGAPGWAVEIFDCLRVANGGTLSGFFDVFAWREPGRAAFFEAKVGPDRIKPTQLRFVEIAPRFRSLDDFMIGRVCGLLGWLGGFGTVCLVGIEGTGSYGAGLARHVTAAGIRVVEVDRSDRQDRRRQGKSDPLDAVSAARAAQSGRARGAPEGRDGAVEAIRALMVAKRSARSERTQAINQARALIVTGPEDLRARFAAHATADLVTDLASLRPRPGAVVGYHTRIALRELGRRAEFLDSQIVCLDALIMPLVTGHAPGLLALHGVGPDTAALLLVAAGDHPERLRSEAAWAHLCAAAPIPASSGKTKRHRLNPAGDRQANHALWRIVITRMSSHPPTRAYVERRTAEGLSKPEIIRCLKRYVARQVYPHLRRR